MISAIAVGGPRTLVSSAARARAVRIIISATAVAARYSTPIRLVATVTALIVPYLAGAQRLSVGPNVHVSVAGARDPHFEMMIAADPAHAERLMACSMVWPTGYTTTEVVTYVSIDSGRSWTPTLRTRGGRGWSSWDPDCVYGPDGVAYSLSEGTDSVGKLYNRVDRSADGGRTWEAMPVAQHAERTFLSVDLSDGPRNGWLFVQGAGTTCTGGTKCFSSDEGGAYLAASTDSGRSFTCGRFVPPDSGGYAIGYGKGAVLSDGIFIAPFGFWKDGAKPDNLPLHNRLGVNRHAPNAIMKVFRVTEIRPNHPFTIEQSKVDDWHFEWQWNGSALPYVAADLSHSPFRDRVYITWPDYRFGRQRILLAYSADKGQTWSRPRVVDDNIPWADGSGPDDLHGVVAVNKDGVVGVMWYDRRDHHDDFSWDVRFRASFDGGESFTPSVSVNEVPYLALHGDAIALDGWGTAPEPTVLGVHSFHFSGGHTAGLAADAAGGFHPLWVDNRTGVPQLWTALVTVTGQVVVNGAADRATLVNASHVVDLRITDRVYRPRAGLIEANVALENVNAIDTVSGPLEVRILSLDSEVGKVRVVSDDAGGAGEGAVWDFTRVLAGGRLLPHERTPARRVQFQVTDPIPVRPGGPEAITALVQFNTKILAGNITVPADTAGKQTGKSGRSPDKDPRR